MELGDFDIIYLWIDPGNCLFATIRLVDSRYRGYMGDVWGPGGHGPKSS